MQFCNSVVALHPSMVGKSSTDLLAGVKVGHVHFCRVAGNIWQVTSHSCEIGFPVNLLHML